MYDGSIYKALLITSQKLVVYPISEVWDSN